MSRRIKLGPGVQQADVDALCGPETSAPKRHDQRASVSRTWGILYPRVAYPSADDALEAAGLFDASVRLVWTVPGNTWNERDKPPGWVGFSMWGAMECWLITP